MVTNHYTKEIYPSSYSNIVNFTLETTTHTITDAYTPADSTSYATLNISTTANTTNTIYFNFDTSVIPANAINIRISCTARARTSTAQTNRISMATVRLYNGSTALGSNVSILDQSTNPAVKTLASDVSMNDLSDIKVFVNIHRSSNKQAAQCNFYGSTLTVDYDVY